MKLSHRITSKRTNVPIQYDTAFPAAAQENKRRFQKNFYDVSKNVELYEGISPTPYEQEFIFNGERYEIEIADVLIHPQGFAAIANCLDQFRGMNMLCDIGHGTMSMMFVNAARPVPGKIYTELMGVHQCALSMKDAAMKEFRARLEDEQIEDFLRHDNAEIPEKVRHVMELTARDYVNRIMGKIGEHGYDPQMMKLHLMGGDM